MKCIKVLLLTSLFLSVGIQAHDSSSEDGRRRGGCHRDDDSFSREEPPVDPIPVPPEDPNFCNTQQTLQTTTICKNDQFGSVSQQLCGYQDEEPEYIYFLSDSTFFKQDIYASYSNVDFEGSIFEFVNFYGDLYNVRFVGSDCKKLLELTFYGNLTNVVFEGKAKDIKFAKGIILDNVTFDDITFCNSEIDTCIGQTYVVVPGDDEGLRGKNRALQTKEVIYVKGKDNKRRAQEILGIHKTCFGKRK